MNIFLKYKTLVFIFIVVNYVFFGLAVSNKLSTEDIKAIKSLNLDKKCKLIVNFKNEIECISFIQTQIKKKVPNNNCPGRFTKIEPKEFLKRGYGCCYDRARITEKSLEYYGFKTRHIFLLHNKYSFIGIAIPTIQSHATSEVLTSKGWLGVDTTEMFMLLSKDNKPYSYREAINNYFHFKDKLRPASFYNNLNIYYGFYSRHGFFHGFHLPGPEVNLTQLLYNFD